MTTKEENKTDSSRRQFLKNLGIVVGGTLAINYVPDIVRHEKKLMGLGTLRVSKESVDSLEQAEQLIKKNNWKVATLPQIVTNSSAIKSLRGNSLIISSEGMPQIEGDYSTSPKGRIFTPVSDFETLCKQYPYENRLGVSDEAVERIKNNKLVVLDLTYLRDAPFVWNDREGDGFIDVRVAVVETGYKAMLRKYISSSTNP